VTTDDRKTEGGPSVVLCDKLTGLAKTCALLSVSFVRSDRNQTSWPMTEVTVGVSPQSSLSPITRAPLYELKSLRQPQSQNGVCTLESRRVKA
jgi:hypothetical protein